MKPLAAVLALLAVAGCSAGSPTDPAAGADPATTVTRPAVTVAPVVPAPGDQRAEFLLADGSKRAYLMHAPPQYATSGALPLVLLFHGSPGSPERMQEMTKMDEVADQHGFLVAYPDQFFDPASVAALLDHLVRTWSVDPARIHAAGYSRGASLTYDLAEQMTDRFGSVAPVSGTGASGRSLAHPISLLTFQGGGDRFRSAFPQTNRFWATSAGCGESEVVTITMEGGPTHIYTSECDGGAEHVVYAIARMGHSWPAEASPLIWDFFARHPMS
jgi:polyhydroxybutyrate depolymerase